MTTKYFVKVLKDHGRRLKPKTNNIYLKKHVQVTLPFFGVENCGHVVMGLFYELLTAGLFGGKLSDSVSLSENGDTIRPDVIDHRNKLAFESKAVRQGHQLNLLDGQIGKYKVFQIRRPSYRVYYALYRHGIQKIKSSKKSRIELEEELAQKTYAAIVLPFSLVLKIFETQQRYENVIVWPDCTRIGSKLINEFLFRPAWAIEQVGGVPDDYRWTRYLTSSKFQVCHFGVTEFPLIWIKDFNHSAWSRKHTEEVPF